MSDEPKTLTLTPEQQANLNHLVEREMDEAYYTGLYMKAKDARACLREFAVEVLEELGVLVVARDEAAELRAATTRLLAALDARDHFIEREEELPHDEWDIAFRRTGDDITNALAVLRRLAGGENEK